MKITHWSTSGKYDECSNIYTSFCSLARVIYANVLRNWTHRCEAKSTCPGNFFFPPDDFAVIDVLAFDGRLFS